MAEQQIQIFVSQDGNAQLEVTVDQDTAWLSLDQMAALFDRDKSVISRHIRTVFKEGKLERAQLLQKMQQLRLMAKPISTAARVLICCRMSAWTSRR